MKYILSLLPLAALVIVQQPSIAAQVSVDCKIVENGGSHDFATVMFDDANRESIVVNTRLIRQGKPKIDEKGESYELSEFTESRIVWTTRYYNLNDSLKFIFYLTNTIDRRSGEYFITSDRQYIGTCVISNAPRKF